MTTERGASQEGLVYIAAPGENNDVTLTREAPGTFTLVDTGAVITPGAFCRALDPHSVTCRAKYAVIDLGDGNDRLTSSIPFGRRVGGLVRITGGAGSKVFTLHRTGRVHVGGSSDFTNRGVFQGTYTVKCGPGNCTVYGSEDGDIILGGSGNNRLYGAGGNDVIAAGTGNSYVEGGSGRDVLVGGDLNATTLGLPQRAGRDVLVGGRGSSLFIPGPGRDRISGGRGSNTVLYAKPMSSPGPPAKLAISFDGRPNDGPPGKHDNISGVQSAISVGSGFLSLADTVVLKGGTYALAGGSSANATVVLLSALGTRGAQFGTFAGSSFTVRPGPRTGPPTEITPTGGDFSRCTTRTRRLRARTAQGSPTLRTLRARARGRFRTQGRYSAATVRGTEWVTKERCDGTLTTVIRGEVSVRDFPRHRTVLVPAGHSYLARAG